MRQDQLLTRLGVGEADAAGKTGLRRRCEPARASLFEVGITQTPIVCKILFGKGGYLESHALSVPAIAWRSLSANCS
jgi:hypothetical protein